MSRQSWWVIGSWFPADEWQAIWSFCTFVVALVAAVLALRQLRQNARGQMEQSRPYVAVDFAAPHGGSAVFIEIRNTGLTAARQIFLTWSERPEVADIEAAQAMVRWVFEGPIPFLAPGRSIRYYLGPFPDNDQRDFLVGARYVGPEERLWKSESVLSFDQWAPAEVDRDPLLEIASQTKRLAESASKSQQQSEQTNSLLEIVAEHFRETPEFKRSAARSRIQRYERQRMARQLSFRTAIRSDSDVSNDSAEGV